MIFKIDFDKWIALMLPTFLRKPRLYAFCRALCAPLYLGDDSVYQRFLRARGDHIYRLSHNGQVCYLRAALNDAFELEKGFEIEDAEDFAGEWNFAKDEAIPENHLLTVDEKMNAHPDKDAPAPEHPVPLLADEARLNAPSNTFIVRVPENIYRTQLDKVKSIVEKYRILSKTPRYTPTRSTNGQSGILINGGREWWQWPLPTLDTRLELYPKPNQSFTISDKDRR